MSEGPDRRIAAPMFTALVLAASRGPGDPVAAMAGCSHKSLVPIAGEAMLARVLRALAASRAVGPLAISMDDPSLLDASPAVAALIESHDIALLDAAATPSLSVARAMDALGDARPILVTTADLPLLSPEIVDHFCASALASGADIAVGLASATIVRERYPDAKRTFIRFRDDGYTGCNLFALMKPRASKAVDFWRRVEPHRKRPWRLASLFGLMAAARFLMAGATLDAAMNAASRRLGLTAAAVRMPFPDSAIDVDKPADKELAETILSRRADQ